MSRLEPSGSRCCAFEFKGPFLCRSLDSKRPLLCRSLDSKRPLPGLEILQGPPEAILGLANARGDQIQKGRALLAPQIAAEFPDLRIDVFAVAGESACRSWSAAEVFFAGSDPFAQCPSTEVFFAGSDPFARCLCTEEDSVCRRGQLD
jgi:hypothetical protein